MKLQQPKESFHHCYTIANNYFLREVSSSKLFQKCKMSLHRNLVAGSTDPLANCSKQNLLNFRSAECLSAEYFIVENFKSQNVDLSADYLQQNLLNSRMFSGIIFHSSIPEIQNVHQQNISQQNPKNADCSSAEYPSGCYNCHSMT